MWSALGIEPLEFLYVVLGSAGVYLTLVVLIRVMGQRSVSSMSNIDMAAVIVIGSVGGRAALGYTPTLIAGAVALVTLFSVRIVVAQIRRSGRGMWFVGNQPVLLVVGGELLEDNMRRTHIQPSELYAKMRVAGVGSHREVALAVLEPTGLISILRRGTVIDPETVATMEGRELIPPEMFTGH